MRLPRHLFYTRTSKNPILTFKACVPNLCKTRKLQNRYNETRLKNHIIDSNRGCRRITPEIRERVRAGTGANVQAMSSSAALPTPSPPQVQAPPAKRKLEAVLSAVTPIQNQPPVVGVGADLDLHDTQQGGADTSASDVRVAVEFSMSSGSLLRATWIAAELLTEFHRDISDVALVPRSDQNTFNMWICGKIVWSRGVGQPLPDYEHLRPIVRAQCCTATL